MTKMFFTKAATTKQQPVIKTRKERRMVQMQKIFVKWLTSPRKGHKIIADFGKDVYGEPLFFPDSIEWRKVRENPAQ
jgi:hypothetical protein